MSTDSGLQFAWGEISRYLSKRYRRYRDICPIADLNYSQEDQEMTISAYPWPFQQLFSRTVRNYAMINTIISFPVQKNSLFMKIFWCIRIELMPHIYDTKTLTMVVEAQQSVNLFEDKKRTTWTGCWQKRGRVELGHRRFLLPKVFCRKCIAPLRNTHLFGPVSGIFVLKGYFQGMKYKQGVPKNKYFSECCWSHGAQAQSLVASTPVSENCFLVLSYQD